MISIQYLLIFFSQLEIIPVAPSLHKIAVNESRLWTDFTEFYVLTRKILWSDTRFNSYRCHRTEIQQSKPTKVEPQGLEKVSCLVQAVTFSPLDLLSCV